MRISPFIKKCFSECGGLRIEDPAMDIAVITAILSSDQNLPVVRHPYLQAN